MNFAVLTGDIVDSSALTAADLDASLDALYSACMEISRWQPDLTAGFARRGGDAWQMAISAPALSLRAVLFAQAGLRRRDKNLYTRIAVAIGDGTLPQDGDTNSAHGPAFTESGRLLEHLPKHVLMSHASGGAPAATLHLADHIARGWTQAQASAMYEILPPGSGPRSKAAEALGITRQAVNQALWSAGYTALDAALAAWEAE
ncbi:MarR family transcriptional regulator [Aliishimia ponticola]|uniref:MarR family transcriptional regulator n=1 Tax=Aliishimia ponticola TaxID=2499833 RepID=A0A4S4NIT5_9RHOB|nr:MarR family transcriptional regulator [Aliishimia ponticola]THH38815.1 MarR family transcriptional regulator [Aliishimia ponticola]